MTNQAHTHISCDPISNLHQITIFIQDFQTDLVRWSRFFVSCQKPPVRAEEKNISEGFYHDGEWSNYAAALYENVVYVIIKGLTGNHKQLSHLPRQLDWWTGPWRNCCRQRGCFCGWGKPRPPLWWWHHTAPPSPATRPRCCMPVRMTMFSLIRAIRLVGGKPVTMPMFSLLRSTRLVGYKPVRMTMLSLISDTRLVWILLGIVIKLTDIPKLVEGSLL